MKYNLIGENGIKLTKGLFREHGVGCGPYTMYPDDKEVDGETFKSVYKIYMNSVNEYDAAMKIVGSMDHWRKLCDCTWFVNGIYHKGQQITSGLKHWREDKAMKDEAEMLMHLRTSAQGGNVQAARYLHEYTQKTSSGRQKKEKHVNPNDQAVKERLQIVKGARNG